MKSAGSNITRKNCTILQGHINVWKIANNSLKILISNKVSNQWHLKVVVVEERNVDCRGGPFRPSLTNYTLASVLELGRSKCHTQASSLSSTLLLRSPSLCSRCDAISSSPENLKLSLPHIVTHRDGYLHRYSVPGPKHTWGASFRNE